MLKCSTALPILLAFIWSKKSSDVLTLLFALNIHKCKNVFEFDDYAREFANTYEK